MEMIHSKIIEHITISMKAHWIRELVEAQRVLIEGVLTEEDIADLFTKALYYRGHEKLVKMMGMVFLANQLTTFLFFMFLKY